MYNNNYVHRVEALRINTWWGGQKSIILFDCILIYGQVIYESLASPTLASSASVTFV